CAFSGICTLHFHSCSEINSSLA
ncbi:hypothetical protein EGK_18429, partial [Macaca mulatta]